MRFEFQKLPKQALLRVLIFRFSCEQEVKDIYTLSQFFNRIWFMRLRVFKGFGFKTQIYFFCFPCFLIIGTDSLLTYTTFYTIVFLNKQGRRRVKRIFK